MTKQGRTMKFMSESDENLKNNNIQSFDNMRQRWPKLLGAVFGLIFS